MVCASSEHRGPEPRGKPKFVLKIDKSGKSDMSYKIYIILSQLLKKSSSIIIQGSVHARNCAKDMVVISYITM